MERVSFVKFRQNLSEYIALAKYKNERIVVTKNGKVMGAFVPKEDLDTIELIENKSDITASEAAFKRNDFTPWKQVKRELDQHHGISD